MLALTSFRSNSTRSSSGALVSATAYGANAQGGAAIHSGGSTVGLSQMSSDVAGFTGLNPRGTNADVSALNTLALSISTGAINVSRYRAGIMEWQLRDGAPKLLSAQQELISQNKQPTQTSYIENIRGFVNVLNERGPHAPRGNGIYAPLYDIRSTLHPSVWKSQVDQITDGVALLLGAPVRNRIDFTSSNVFQCAYGDAVDSIRNAGGANQNFGYTPPGQLNTIVFAQFTSGGAPAFANAACVATMQHPVHPGATTFTITRSSTIGLLGGANVVDTPVVTIQFRNGGAPVGLAQQITFPANGNSVTTNIYLPQQVTHMDCTVPVALAAGNTRLVTVRFQTYVPARAAFSDAIQDHLDGLTDLEIPAPVKFLTTYFNQNSTRIDTNVFAQFITALETLNVGGLQPFLVNWRDYFNVFWWFGEDANSLAWRRANYTAWVNNFQIILEHLLGSELFNDVTPEFA